MKNIKIKKSRIIFNNKILYFFFIIIIRFLNNNMIEEISKDILELPDLELLYNIILFINREYNFIILL